MFDFGFSELVVIGIVMLIVVGPERLPKVARTVGHFVGKAQRYAAQVRDEVNRQIELEELRKTQQEIQAAAQQFEQTIHQEIHKAETEVSQIHQELAQVKQEIEHVPLAADTSGPAVDTRSGDLFASQAIDLSAQLLSASEEQEFLARQMDLFADPASTQPNPPKAG